MDESGPPESGGYSRGKSPTSLLTPSTFTVIPAQAGIQRQRLQETLDSRLRGNDEGAGVCSTGNPEHVEGALLDLAWTNLVRQKVVVIHAAKA
ncbi:MAG: hypothetical protein WBC18_29025, partial [Ottowia sp.]